MSWKCFFGHKWKMKISQTVNVWEAGNQYPSRIYTNFLFQCCRCEKMKVQKLNGSWEQKRRDDDDDRGDRQKVPQLSPDDYFELLDKK